MHSDLLETIRSLIDDIPADYGQFTLLNAMEAVLQLHKPQMVRGNKSFYAICVGCFEYEGQNNDYPCPTIQAIEKVLR